MSPTLLINQEYRNFLILQMTTLPLSLMHTTIMTGMMIITLREIWWWLWIRIRYVCLWSVHLQYYTISFISHTFMFYIQEMTTHDVQDNQLMSEGKTRIIQLMLIITMEGHCRIQMTILLSTKFWWRREWRWWQTNMPNVIRPTCAWGMDAGITQYLGTPYGEYCCCCGWK